MSILKSRTVIGITALLCVLITAGYSEAQNGVLAKPTGCPAISVSGPSGVTSPGDYFYFSASVDPAVPDLKFRWEISLGQISQGQSTEYIRVLNSKEMAGYSLMATVTISGLPIGCPNTASESVSQCGGLPVPALIAEFAASTKAIDSRELKNAADELLENPNEQLYIIEYFPWTANKSVISRKVGLVSEYLVGALKFDKARITIVVGRSDDGRPRTKIYRIPLGATNPEP